MPFVYEFKINGQKIDNVDPRFYYKKKMGRSIRWG